MWRSPHNPPHPPVRAASAAVAAQATAVAVWAVWNQVDCDNGDLGPYTEDYSCSDDSQNINRAATIGPLLMSRNLVTVPVTILVVNVPETYRVTVDTQTWQATIRLSAR